MKKKITSQEDYWEKNIKFQERKIWLQILAIALILISIFITLTDFHICSTGC